MEQRNRQFQPPPRGPLEVSRREKDDPALPDPELDVKRLASPSRLERMQAENRLRARGAEGLMEVARSTSGPGEPEQRVKAIEFVMNADLEIISAEQAAEVRTLLAGGLDSARPASVRAAAAWALRVHGPGSEQTPFLLAIKDSERRVRWAVVERLGANPTEVNATQCLILVSLLRAGTAEEFDGMDGNRNGVLERTEFSRSDEEFARLDADADGAVSRDEWINPVSPAVRTDVVALLLRVQANLTPGRKPINYNPDLPAGEQLEAVAQWQAWAESLSR